MPDKERRKWRILLIGLFVVIAIGGFVASLSKGAVVVSHSEIINALFSHGVTGNQSQIIWNIRLPRALVAILVGIHLSLAGALLQGVMRNPLADPHIIGVSSGAGLAGVIILVLFPHQEYLVTPVAFLGALAAAGLIYLLAWKGSIKPTRIILAGVAVSAFLNAGISSLLVFFSDRVHGALMWMVGGLAARSWPHVELLWPYTLVGCLLALTAASRLNLLSLGDEMARGLGIRVEASRLWLTALAALLAASAVSVVGLLGFVGLIVPHGARLLVGSDYRYLLPASACLGAAVMTWSDLAARTLFSPVEIPVGIIMALAGAPFFLYLLRREA
ncbi:iron ABC transporter permease [Azotosporobacter soli]|uniref:FecCD family ABC transporter permease n=1 Tax=Azotosporobacter soli TaxID=3055040 RepID=UPI0031FE6D2B